MFCLYHFRAKIHSVNGLKGSKLSHCLELGLKLALSPVHKNVLWVECLKQNFYLTGTLILNGPRTKSS